MAQKSDTQNPFSAANLNNLMGNFSSTNIDYRTLVETQRKNAQALGEAMKITGEGFQAYGQRCAELMSQFVEEQSRMAKELMGEGSPEEKISKQTDLIKKNYDKSIGNAKELTDLLSKSGQEASEILNKRVSASLNEFKTALANSNIPPVKKAS